MERGPGRGSLVVIFLTVFVDLLGFGIVLPLLPIYARQFGVDEAGVQLGLLMASFSAMQFFFAPFWGRLSDRVGRRPILMVGLAGSVVFYAMFGWATVRQSLALLFVSRVGAGIFGATLATAQAYIADCTPQSGRARGMALIGMAFGFGFTFGPLLGSLAVGAEVDRPGPWPGYVAASLSGIALLLAFWLLPEPPSRTSAETEHRRGLAWTAWREALRTPTVPMLLAITFFSVFSFANFETTLSMVLSARSQVVPAFAMNDRQVFYMFAFVGFVLAVVQGGLVRRLAGRVPESRLAASGAALEMLGLLAMVAAIRLQSVPALLAALTIVVGGFAFLPPSINGLLSRRTSADRQGLVLGVGQSVNSLARIVGAALGIPLLSRHPHLPYYVATALMFLSLVLIALQAGQGRDDASEQAEGTGVA